MKKRSKINFKNLGFVFIYSALFLLLAVNNSSFYFAKSVKTNKKAQTSSHSSQSKEDTSNSEESVLQAFSVEAVVPLTILTLGYISHFIFSISFPSRSELNVYYGYVPSIPAALENTFEHHIAINAP